MSLEKATRMARSHLQAVLPVMEEVEEEQHSAVVVNGWTVENEQTLKSWLHHTDLACFVYNDTAEWYEKLMTVITVVTILLSGVITAISVVAITLGSVSMVWVFVLNGIIAVASGAITIGNGLVKMLFMAYSQRQYVQYVGRLQSFWMQVNSELHLSASERFDADDYIRRMNGQYEILMQLGPAISKKTCDTAIEKYNLLHAL